MSRFTHFATYALDMVTDNPDADLNYLKRQQQIDFAAREEAKRRSILAEEEAGLHTLNQCTDEIDSHARRIHKATNTPFRAESYEEKLRASFERQVTSERFPIILLMCKEFGDLALAEYTLFCSVVFEPIKQQLHTNIKEALQRNAAERLSLEETETTKRQKIAAKEESKIALFTAVRRDLDALHRDITAAATEGTDLVINPAKRLTEVADFYQADGDSSDDDFDTCSPPISPK